jgi:UDP-N-acetylglucosamine/UDP-N-acetylgalactosamine 4-epimerase
MRVLVTGGAGFIGSHIVDILLKLGHFVLVIDNLSTGNMKNIQHNTKNENFAFVLADINDTLFTLRNVKKYEIDTICHQAALGSFERSLKTPELTHSANADTFFNILNIARDNNIKRVVYASCSSVYGTSTKCPKTEATTGKPLTPYALSKVINEMYADIFTKCFNMECIGLRYFNVFGPRQPNKGDYISVIPNFINKLKNNESPVIYDNGNQNCDFTYITNVVVATVNALLTQNKHAYGQVINIGTSSKISVNTLYKTLARVMDKQEITPVYKEKRKEDIQDNVASINKAQTMLDYKVLVNFEDGLKETLKFYNN